MRRVGVAKVGRVGDLRVFYDVDEESQELVVRAIRRKGTKRTKEIL